MARYPERLAPEAVSAYRTAVLRPEVRHAIMNDYRAGATLDEAHDQANRANGRRLDCPIYVTWESGRYHPDETPIDIWRRWARDVDGAAIEAGHLQAEEAPQELLELITPFLNKHNAPGKAA
jgi:haloacetate dehalogenase